MKVQGAITYVENNSRATYETSVKCTEIGSATLYMTIGSHRKTQNVLIITRAIIFRHLALHVSRLGSIFQ
jgi:hypothetical protein